MSGLQANGNFLYKLKSSVEYIVLTFALTSAIFYLSVAFIIVVKCCTLSLFLPSSSIDIIVCGESFYQAVKGT